MAAYILDKIKTAEGLVDLLTKSDGANVNVTYPTTENPSASKTLDAAISDILKAIKDLPTGTGVDAKIKTAIDGLIDGAPDAYNTLKEISDYITENGQGDIVATLNTAIGNKVDKVTDMGLSHNDFTDALLAKLNGIAEGATKVEDSETNGNVKIGGAETVVYTHPTATEKGAAFVKVGNDAAGHVVIGDAVAKDDITALGIPGQDTTYTAATQSEDGLMSSADKKKVDEFRGVRLGDTAPSDMQVGELFVKIVS